MEKIITKKIVQIGKRVRSRRTFLELTLFELAVDSDVSLSVISDLERGVSSGMTVSTLVKIANALQMSSDELYCEKIC